MSSEHHDQHRAESSVCRTADKNDAAQQIVPVAEYTSPKVSLERGNPNASMARRRVVIGSYTLVSTLGSGSMGKVKLAVHNDTSQTLAVKIIPRKAAASQSRGKRKPDKDVSREIRTLREASIMQLLHHPYIASLKEWVTVDRYYYLFMEHVSGGQLLDYIIAHSRLKEKHARRFVRQIVSAVDYCHRNSIVHRDLKIENILISSEGHVKIIDFGLSNLFSQSTKLSTFCGSLYFAAPELLHAKAYIGPEVDVWSMGIILYVLVCGKVPFDDQSVAMLHTKIKRGHVKYPSYLSSDCKNLLSRMLVTNPTQRATVSEIRVHPWMNKGYDSPVENHVPCREPLTLPVDLNVIQHMAGFGFGTEQEIRQQLESIITSEEYQQAAKMLALRTSERQCKNHKQPSRKKVYPLPNDDPQSIPAAYHPLVSIYYLAREKIEREHRAAVNANRADTAKDASPTSIISFPQMARSADTSAKHSGMEVGHDPHRTARNQIAMATGGKGGKDSGCVRNTAQTIDAGRSAQPREGVRHPFQLPFNRISVSFSKEGESADKGRLTILRRISLAIGRSSSKGSRHHHSRRHSDQQDAHTAPLATMEPSRSETATRQQHSTPESKLPHADQLQNKVVMLLNKPHGANPTESNTLQDECPSQQQAAMSRTDNSIEDKVPSDKVPIQQIANVQIRETGTTYQHDQAYPHVTSCRSQMQKGTGDEAVPLVFLKGSFSVSTTSTKRPSVIRADLIHVLEHIGVKWKESKGRFECVHVPNIDMNCVVEGNTSATDQQVSSASVTVPDQSVRFEIFIVKITWLLGMNGLQFRRVSGDTWLYKNMCSRILSELKL